MAPGGRAERRVATVQEPVVKQELSRSWPDVRLRRLGIGFGVTAFAVPPLRSGRRRLARVTGLEPATTGSTIQCSNQLSYTPASRPGRH